MLCQSQSFRSSSLNNAGKVSSASPRTMISTQGKAAMVATSTTDACGPPMMIFACGFSCLTSWANLNVSGYELQIELNPKMSQEMDSSCLATKGKKNSAGS